MICGARRGSDGNAADGTAEAAPDVHPRADAQHPVADPGFTIYEPVPGFAVELQVDPPPCPYESVHDAVCDGWQVVQFPLHQADFDDDDLDMVGYEFVLQKMEVVE